MDNFNFHQINPDGVVHLRENVYIYLFSFFGTFDLLTL